MKKKFQKLTSILLSAALCLQLLPAATVHTHAAEGDTVFTKPTDYAMTFVDGISYLLAAPVNGGESYHVFSGIENGVVQYVEVMPEDDGSIVIPAGSEVEPLTYHINADLTVSGMYFDDGTMLYYDMAAGALSVISADEAAALTDYRTSWNRNGTTDDDFLGGLSFNAGGTLKYLTYNAGAAEFCMTDYEGNTSFWDTDVYTGFYVFKGPCPHTNVVLNTDIAFDATCMTPGTLPRWVCGDCKSYFADEALTQPLMVDEYILDEATGHNFVDGICVNCGSDRALYTPVRNQMQLEEVMYGGNNDVTGQVYEPTFMLVASTGDTLYAMAPDLSLIPVSTNEIGMIPAEGLQAAQFSLVDTLDPDTYALRYAILLPNEWLYAEETSLATLPVLDPNTLDQGPMTDNGYWQLMLYDPDAEYYDALNKTTVTMSEYMTANTSLTELGKGALLLYENYTNDPAQTLRMQSNDDGYSLVLGPDVEGAGTQIALYLYASVDHSRDADEGHSWRTTYEDGVHMNQCACGLYIETDQHNWKAEISDPTCTEDGTVWLFCDGCQATHSPNGTVIPATGHNWSPWYVMAEPSSAEPGSEIRYCLNNCGTYDENGYTPYSETRTIPYLGHTAHNLQYVEKVEATCSEYGIEAHYACQPEEATTGGDVSEYCYNLYADANGTQRVTMEDLMIPVQDHAWGEWVDVDTSNADYTLQNRTCSGCGEMERRTVPPGGHVHQMVYVEAMEPGCFPGNIAYYVCDYYGTTEYEVGCGCYFEDAEGTIPLDAEDVLIPATGHNWGEWYNTGNEKEAGMHERQCLDCQYIEWGEHIVSPYAENSTDEIECYYVCMVEGCDYHQVIGEHSMSDWEFDDDDSHIRYCYECGYEVRETHEYGAWSYNTYSDGTFHERTCGICSGTQLKLEDEHIWGEVVSVPPSCSEVGTDTVTCIAEGCGAQNITEVPTLDHTPMEAVKENERESTCTVAGAYDSVVYCSVCKNEMSRETISVPVVPHEMSDWTETMAPGCETGGTEVSSCINCGHTESREIPATNHSYTSVVTPSTCTAQGYTTHTCGTCGYSYVSDYTDYAKHIYNGIVTAPSCTDQGYTTYTCVNCTDSYVGSYVSALGHALSDWVEVTTPTQIKDGLKIRHCSNGCNYAEECVIPAYGHTHHLVLVPGKAATCQVTGNIAYYKCEYEMTQEDIAPDEASLNMSCSGLYIVPDGGEMVSEDDLVLVSEQDIIIPLADHDMGEWVTDENKSTDLFTVQIRTCRNENCGYSESRNLPGANHVHSMTMVEGVAPSCLTNGNITYFICEGENGCGNAYADAQGGEILEKNDLILPAVGHTWSGWTSDASAHRRTCSACSESQSEAHVYSHTSGTESACVLTCLICDYDTTFGAHVFEASWVPCADRWQHQKTCTNNCGYALIENHSFGGWIYGSYQLPESSGSVMIHYRTCGCGAAETTGGHIWDEGTSNANRTEFHCTASGCTGMKEEYLRCFHTCFTCGKCTADVTCHDKDTCTCVTPEPLPLIDPDVIINTEELPYLGDIIIRDENAPLDPDAAPGQEIPDEYAGYRVEIKEIPLDVDDARDNPYTQYVIQALDGYSPVYMFDIHLLDGEGDIIYSQENEQYLIRLNLEAQIVQDIRDGLVRLAHVTEDGTTFYGVSADKSVLPFYKLEGNMAWFWADSFSPFTLVEPEAPYFGRSALAKMDNKDNLLYAYDALVAGVEASEAKIQLYAETPAITIDEAKMVMDAYTRDHTEHFWLDNKYSLTYQKGTVFAKHIKPVYSLAGDELAQAKETFNAAVDELLKGVTDASEFDRQLILHDRLAAQVTYDYSFAKPDIYNAYGAIVRGEAVCQGYAEALQYLLRRVGIQSFIVTGFSNDVSHAWNQVKVDNEYYHTDLTWNDQENRLYHAYFNMNDPYITEDHEIYITAYPTVECADMSANYFTVKELARESGEIDDIAKLLKANNYQMSIMLTGTTSAKDFIDWFADNYLAIIKAAGVSDNVLSCSFSRLGREAVVDIKLKVPVIPEEPDEPEEPENPDPSVSVTAEKSAGAVSVTAKCTGSMNGYLMIAVYNSSNKMIGIKVVEETKLRGGTYSISVSRSETPTHVKAFVLDPKNNPMLPEAMYTIP